MIVAICHIKQLLLIIKGCSSGVIELRIEQLAISKTGQGSSDDLRNGSIRSYQMNAVMVGSISLNDFAVSFRARLISSIAPVQRMPSTDVEQIR